MSLELLMVPRIDTGDRVIVNAAQDILLPVTAKALRLAWQRLKKRAGIEDLRFNDLRHEAVSRFFELGLTPPEVALISGRRDPRMLFQYAHTTSIQIRSKLDERSNGCPSSYP